MTSSALRAGIIIVSDTAAKDPSSDRSILTLKDVFEEKGGDTWEVQETVIVSDDILEIQRSVIAWTDGSDPLNLILTSGGTGFATKDNTPEVRLHDPFLTRQLTSFKGYKSALTQACLRPRVRTPL